MATSSIYLGTRYVSDSTTDNLRDGRRESKSKMVFSLHRVGALCTRISTHFSAQNGGTFRGTQHISRTKSYKIAAAVGGSWGGHRTRFTRNAFSPHPYAGVGDHFEGCDYEAAAHRGRTVEGVRAGGLGGGWGGETENTPNYDFGGGALRALGTRIEFWRQNSRVDEIRAEGKRRRRFGTRVFRVADVIFAAKSFFGQRRKT